EPAIFENYPRRTDRRTATRKSNKRARACGGERSSIRRFAGNVKLRARSWEDWQFSEAYSHSMVPGGFEVTSYTTRFTPFTSFTIRLEIVLSTSCGSGTQSAVIPSSECTAR